MTTALSPKIAWRIITSAIPKVYSWWTPSVWRKRRDDVWAIGQRVQVLWRSTMDPSRLAFCRRDQEVERIFEARIARCKRSTLSGHKMRIRIWTYFTNNAKLDESGEARRRCRHSFTPAAALRL